MVFNPTIDPKGAPEKVKIPPGKYPAACVSVADPRIYKAYNRWFLRVDFRVEDSAAVVSRYVNINEDDVPAKMRTKFSPRTGYYKLCAALAAGDGPIDFSPEKLIGRRALITVVDENGYSVAKAVESLPLKTQYSVLNTHSSSLFSQSSVLSPQVSATQERERDSFNDTDKASPKNGQLDSQSDQTEPITLLLRAFGKVSDNRIVFWESYWPKLSDLLRAYSEKELVSAFKRFLDDLNLDDPMDRKFAAKNFLAVADSICKKARDDKAEREQEKVLRDQTVARLQAEAEQERLVKAKKEAEEELFDPLSA